MDSGLFISHTVKLVWDTPYVHTLPGAGFVVCTTTWQLKESVQEILPYTLLGNVKDKSNYPE